MKRQKGAALIVVLSLLTISLMVGLSSMQSSQIDERLAGNYRAQSQAQMNAELGLSRFHDCLITSGWPQTVEERNNCLVEGDSFSYLPAKLGGIDDEEIFWGAGSVRLVSRGEMAGASQSIFAEFLLGGSLLDLMNGAFTCYGFDCIVSPGQGQASNSFNGYDHEVDPEVGCSIKGSNVPSVDEDSELHSAGVFMVEGTLESGSEGNIDGHPEPTVTSFEDAREYLGMEEGATHAEITDELNRLKDDFNEKFDAVSGNASTTGTGSASGLSVFHYAGPGETISLDGNAGGVIILEGGTLEMKGNSCFSGLVLAKESYVESKIIVPEFDSRGTAAIVGGVVGQSIDFSGKGTPSVYFSSSAIQGVSDPLAGGFVGEGVEISLWSDL